MDDVKTLRRHKAAYRIGHLISYFELSKFGYRHDKAPRLTEPCLIVSNHLTESDLYSLLCDFPKHMYFVCGEHLFRTKLGPFIKKYFDPIPAPRGGSMLHTVMQILKRLKEGHNIMMFPEGTRSFTGVTDKVDPSIGKLIKKAGCGLVTHKIIGGFFIAPRWGHKFRTGHMEGRIQNVYTSAQLKELSAEEITELINRDLHEDAYERQRKHPLPYRCKERAEGLENFLEICPECGAYDSMVTSGDTFRCSKCGLAGTYNEYGFLQGTGNAKLPFNNVRDWGTWMEKRFDEDMTRRDLSQCLFTEKNIRLYSIDAHNHTNKDIITDGELRIYADRLEIGDYVFDFAGISECSMLYFGKSWLFTHTSGYFGLTGETFHAWKLHRLFIKQFKESQKK